MLFRSPARLVALTIPAIIGVEPGTGAWGYYDTGIACLRSRQRDDCPALCEPNGTVEAFDVEGFSRIGEFASVADAAAFACSDVEMPRLDS